MTDDDSSSGSSNEDDPENYNDNTSENNDGSDGESSAGGRAVDQTESCETSQHLVKPVAAPLVREEKAVTWADGRYFERNGKRGDVTDEDVRINLKIAAQGFYCSESRVIPTIRAGVRSLRSGGGNTVTDYNTSVVSSDEE